MKTRLVNGLVRLHWSVSAVHALRSVLNIGELNLNAVGSKALHPQRNAVAHELVKLLILEGSSGDHLAGHPFLGKGGLNAVLVIDEVKQISVLVLHRHELALGMERRTPELLNRHLQRRPLLGREVAKVLFKSILKEVNVERVHSAVGHSFGYGPFVLKEPFRFSWYNTMKRVFVTCHNPSTHGELTWEGHEIVGYVDITPGDQPSVGKYYEGWGAVPASLRGTIDLVLAMFCPVGGDLERGDIKTLAAYTLPFLRRDGTPMIITVYDDVFVKAFALLKPGGSLLFPGTDTIAASSRELLEWKLPPPPAGQDRNRVKNTVSFADIGDVRPHLEEMPESEHESEPEYSDAEEDEEEEDESEEDQKGGNDEGLQRRRPWLIVTKPMAGGRRRKRKTYRKRHSLSSRRKSMRR